MTKQQIHMCPQRVIYLDFLRILATFGVIALHVYCTEYNSAYISLNWYIALIGDSLVRWSVPIFVMISGALFLNPSKEVTIKSILLKYVSRLLITYFFWTLVYGTIRAVTDMSNGETFNIMHLLAPHFHLWFLPMLTGLYLLIPILKKIVHDEKLVKYTLILWCVLLLGSFYEINQIPQIANLFKMNSIIGFVGYFLLGYYLSQKSFSKQQRHWIYILGIAGAVITISGNLLASLYEGKASILFMRSFTLNVVLMAMALFVFFKENASSHNKAIMHFVEFVRKDLFGIYLTHALWLLVLNHPIVRDCCNQLITLPILTIAIFFLSLFTTKLIRLIPIARKVVE